MLTSSHMYQKQDHVTRKKETLVFGEGQFLSVCSWVFCCGQSLIWSETRRLRPRPHQSMPYIGKYQLDRFGGYITFCQLWNTYFLYTRQWEQLHIV